MKDLLFMVRKNKVIIYVAIMTFIVISSVRSYAESMSKAGYKDLAGVDSIKFFYPEKEGVFSTSSLTREDIVNLVKEYNISGKTITKTTDAATIENIEKSINLSEISSILVFDVSETMFTASIRSSLMNWIPGLQWYDADKEAVKGCALIYIRGKSLLIWFGLDFVDIYNLRLDCNIIDIIIQNI